MQDDLVKQSRILIADAQACQVDQLDFVLRQAGYQNLLSATEAREALSLWNTAKPDLLLLDLDMPDGLAVLTEVRRQVHDGTYLPALVSMTSTDPHRRLQAMSAGARDFVIKPFDRAEVQLRVANLLETGQLYRRLADQDRRLADQDRRLADQDRRLADQDRRCELRLRDRTRDLEAAQMEVLEDLATAAEYRDDDTGEHTMRVARTTRRIAMTMGCSAPDVELFTRVAPLHDVGKIGIPDGILLKPGKLTPEEWAVMKAHTTIGAAIITESRFPLLQMAQKVTLSHHERWDGTGYPNGLAGEAIPLVGRIVAVADVFDALTYERPYKKAWPVDQALAEIRRQAGTQFDPQVVAAFLRTV